METLNWIIFTIKLIVKRSFKNYFKPLLVVFSVNDSDKLFFEKPVLLESKMSNNFILDAMQRNNYLSQVLLSKDDISLSPSAVDIGIGNIEYFISEIKNLSKDKHRYLFGINNGGMFLAKFLAHRIDLRDKYLFECDYINGVPKSTCEVVEENSVIILIDDICRTGKTIKAVKEFLSLKFKGNKIYSFVLVCNTRIYDAQNAPLIDYAPWLSPNTNIKLPWSGNHKNKKKYEFDDVEINQVVARILPSTKMLPSNQNPDDPLAHKDSNLELSAT